VPDIPQDSTLRLVTALMPELNRHDPLDEAAFAAIETVVYVLLARNERDGPDSIESMRQALGSARATVIAAGYALSVAVDASRRATANTAAADMSATGTRPAFNRRDPSVERRAIIP
jgi:hypothetical protein